MNSTKACYRVKYNRFASFDEKTSAIFHLTIMFSARYKIKTIVLRSSLAERSDVTRVFIGEKFVLDAI